MDVRTIPARDRADGVVAGVAAGIAARARGRSDARPPALRVLTLAGGAGIALYLAGALLMPEEPGRRPSRKRTILGLALVLLADPGGPQRPRAAAVRPVSPPRSPRSGVPPLARQQRVAGVVFLALGSCRPAHERRRCQPGRPAARARGRRRRPPPRRRAVALAARPRARRGAHGADPLGRARGGRGARARLGAADARARPAARRRAAPRRVARAAAGARAARAGSTATAARRARRSRARSRPRRTRSRSCTACAIELASGGDCAARPTTCAPVVLAAREAMANAAKFSGADEISVYAEAERRARQRLRPRPRRRLRPRRGARRPARPGRVDRGPDGARRRSGRDRVDARRGHGGRADAAARAERSEA